MEDSRNMSSEMTRRGFVAAAGAVTAGAAAAALAGQAAQTQALADETDSSYIADLPYGKQDYDVADVQDFDIIVVGTGNSGMCAAMEAADQGVRVAVVEKQDHIGGMSFGTEGAFGLGSQMQKDAGVEEPAVSDCVTEELVYTNYRVDANFWRDVFAHSGEDIDWLVERGVLFDRVDSYQGASSFKCFHWWPGGTGSEVGSQVEAYLAGKDNVTVLTETEVIDLVEQDGAIAGVYARTADGSIVQINAPATVMATGGFGENHERVQQCTGIDMSRGSSFGGPDTGEGHDMMLAHGAAPFSTCGMFNLGIAKHPITLNDDITVAAACECLPQINQDGERFMAEDIYAKKYSALQINALRSQKAAYTLLDEDTIERFETDGIDFAYVSRKPGDKLLDLRDQLAEAVADPEIPVYEGDTLADLAEAIGADPAKLQATVDRFNEFTASGVDEDFGCEASYMHGIGSGPYYALMCDPTVITTIGGIDVNRDNQVVDADFKPIKGLYCVGVESCTLYKETYNFQLSGGMNAYCFYSGRNAVRSALGVKE